MGNCWKILLGKIWLRNVDNIQQLSESNLVLFHRFIVSNDNLRKERKGKERVLTRMTNYSNERKFSIQIQIQTLILLLFLLL